MVSTTRTATDADWGMSPRNKATFDETVNQSLGGLNNTIDTMGMRADPDAQATVTDFLDFTEYLPSDIVRSLTLIGKLDENYADASTKVDELTTTWSKLPTLPRDSRPSPVQLRADISETLRRALSSRMYSHAEATRMAENVNRHYIRAKTILSKLQTMLENLPTEEQKSPVAASRSPQLTRTPKPALRVTDDGQKVRRQRVPKIIVPGEVLAPYELGFDAYADDSDGSTTPEQMESPTGRTPSRATAAVTSRIKIVNKTQKTPKPPKTPAAASALPTAGASSAKPVKVHYPGANSTSPIVLHPPPDGVLPGTADAPWMQLTAYEMAMLRKRMKKNASWSPSDTMIARELQRLSRGPEAYRAAKKKAEDEGLPLSNNVLTIPADESGSAALGEGAISVDVMTDGIPLSNRGVKLNEAKKLKHDAMGKQAAEEAEASHRKLAEMANFFRLGDMTPSSEGSAPEGNGRATGNGKTKRTGNKRKRDAAEEPEPDATLADDAMAGKPGKRVKTETPVPPPQLTVYPSSQPRSVTPIPPPSVPQSVTPVPVPIPPTSSSVSAKTSASPPMSVLSTGSAITIPTKPPAEPQATPTATPAPTLPGTREQPRRETRQEAAKKQHQAQPLAQQEKPAAQSVTAATTPKAASRGPTPAPGDVALARRPASRGKAASQEPAPSLAADRRRRSSTARNTPAPEANPPRQPNKRSKRPAPGVVSTLSSGGSSAVGKRKAAPKRKARAQGQKRGRAAAAAAAADQGQGQEAADVEMEEVDDEGNPIDPEEPRYCLCNRVSFGTMILCENKDNCKVEWFHLDCVGLTDAPARTTKWYCPDCRVLLNIGEKGEVNARGVKK